MNTIYTPINQIYNICNKYKNFKDIPLYELKICDNIIKIYDKIDFLYFNDSIKNALFQYCINNNLNIIKYIITNLKINKNDILRANRDGQNIFHICCYNNRYNILKYLIKKFNVTNIDLIIKNKLNVLHICCDNNKIKMLKYVVKKCYITKSDLFISCNFGYNTLNLCNLKIFKYIIKHFNITKDDLLYENDGIECVLISVLSYGCDKYLKYIVKRYNLVYTDFEQLRFDYNPDYDIQFYLNICNEIQIKKYKYNYNIVFNLIY